MRLRGAHTCKGIIHTNWARPIELIWRIELWKLPGLREGYRDRMRRKSFSLIDPETESAIAICTD